MTLREYMFAMAQAYRQNIRTAVHAGDLGLNGMHVRCLHIIAQTPQCTANCIVKRMGRDKAQIARLVKEMLAYGWLLKQPSEQDKRSQVLHLSASGQALQQQISQLELQLEQRMLTGLSGEEVAEFKRIADKLLANLVLE